MEKKNKSLGDLSTNFWSKEFRCICPKCRRKKVRVSSRLLFKLEMMIMIIDRGLDFHRPVIVLSGNRCEEENKRIGGFPSSEHIPDPDGEAADIKVIGMKPIELGLIAEEVGGLRIGIAKWGIHVDVKPPSPSRFWVYMGKKPIYSGSIENTSLAKFYDIILNRK
ncbi:hypothetical protein ES704_01016 [subsurface metagenome]|jgi:uncharacterized protein YcbK (DUF882 family)